MQQLQQMRILLNCSETPVEKAYGEEVLSHLPDAANLARLNDPAPDLWAFYQCDHGNILKVDESKGIKK